MRRAVVVLAIAAVVAALWWWQSGPGRGVEGALSEGHDVGDMSRLPGPDRAAAPVLPAALAAISGRVRGPDAAPIVGAQVCARVGRGGPGTLELWAPTCVTSGPDGAYRIEPLLPARWRVEANARGRIPAEYAEADGGRPVQLVAGGEAHDIDLVLWPGGVELRGVVRDLTGGEIEGAEVSFERGTAFSGADGRFSMWVRPGIGYAEARAEGYARASAQATAPSGAVELELFPESVLIGRVVRAEDGLPIAGAKVSGREYGEEATYTDASGQFRIGGLMAGTYKPRAESDEAWGLAEVGVTLGFGETSAPVTIRAHKATSVRGRIVIAGGASCESGRVTLTDPATRRSAAGSTEQGGELTVRGVAPGTHEVTVWCFGHVPEDTYEPVVVGEQAVSGLSWRVRAGRKIRGRIVDSSGAPVITAGVRGKLEGGDPRAFASQAGAQVQPDGSFALVGLKPGRYALTASREGGAPTPTLAVEVPEDRDVDGIELVLAAGGEVRGRVVDGQGKPVRRAFVSLWGDVQAGWGAAVDDDGKFSLTGVPVGAYRATVSGTSGPLRAPGSKPDALQGTAVEVAVGRVAQLELVVEAAVGEIAGKVVDETGEPVADVRVACAWESDRQGAASALRRLGQGGGRDRPVITDADGRFRLGDLSPGTYAIRATLGGGAAQAVAERVALGSEVVLVMPAAGEIGGVVRPSRGATPEWIRVSAQDDKLPYYRSDEFFRTGGRFALTGLPPGTYTVRADAGDGSVETTVTLASGQIERGVELVLAPRLTVKGRVIDLETGEPVAGVRVDARVKIGLGSRVQGPGNASDASGRFQIEGVPAGVVTLSLSPPVGDAQAYTTAWVPILVEGTDAVEVPAIGLLRGRLPAGKNVGDLGFSLQEAPPDQDPRLQRWIVSSVRAGGPAASAGLQVGDEVVAVDGHSVSGADGHRFHVLTRVAAGRTLQLGLARGETIALTPVPVR